MGPCGPLVMPLYRMIARRDPGSQGCLDAWMLVMIVRYWGIAAVRIGRHWGIGAVS